jgi:hypothetical protein
MGIYASNWNNGAFGGGTDFGWTWEGSGRGLNSSTTLGFKFHLVTRTEVFQFYSTLKFLHNRTVHRGHH